MCERSDLVEYNPSSWIWVFTDLGWIRTLIRSGMKLFRPSYTFSSLGKFREHSFIPPCSSTVNMTSDKSILTKSPTIPPSFSCSNASTLSSQESYNVSRVSPLHHPEYKRMRKKLESEAHTNLDVACLHILVRWSQNSLSSLTWILFSGNLKVSQRVLDLDALSLNIGQILKESTSVEQLVSWTSLALFVNIWTGVWRLAQVWQPQPAGG